MVQLGVTAGFDEIVRRHGGEPDRVIEASGLKPAFASAPSKSQTPQITLGAFSSFLRAAATECRLPTFSVEFAHAFDVRSLGAIGYLFQLAPDLGTALRDFCAYFELVQDNTEIGLETHGDLARITYSVHGGSPEDKAPDAEFSVAMLAAALGAGWSKGSDVCRVDLEYRPNWHLDAAPAWLKTDIRPSSAGNAVLVPSKMLDQPGCFADAYLYGVVARRVVEDHRNLATRRSFVSMVTEALTSGFSRHEIELTTAVCIANEFGISTRTLHRQLALFGSNFRDLRNSVMLHSAKELLTDTENSVTDVALMLGFSETAAFSRAFRHLAGQTPVQFQRSGRSPRNLFARS
ncbi:helix-turn-helix protein [Pseudaminobacter salicylatoxidans]|uniref:Helix-turn-helix protein n=1 Tax=Pseudaminobacter salicylatoxidans TaxID=93369 RepID=A0A316C4D7_PSESE|nr:AraC family transcriptional regulator [Pseudaminobacter salicylatoxidans]PWJ84559.1 helix-turn-helix protein [Pseudaminobacter salicylatoxidans]